MSTMSTMTKILQFENLFNTYTTKCQRVDELRAQGRYGYQLRMPKRAVALAALALRDWCCAHHETSPV